MRQPVATRETSCFRSGLLLAPAVASLLGLACGSEPDAARGDAARSDASGGAETAADVAAASPAAADASAEGLDASSGPDASGPDGAADGPDAAQGLDAGASPDAAAGAPDVAAPDCGAPMDMTRFAARCDGRWVLGGDFSYPDGGAGCAPFVRLDGTDHPDRAAALQAESCDTDCVLEQRMSVSAVFCRGDCVTLQRYGWITFATDVAGCPELYELPHGLFASVADWLAAQPDVCARGATACLDDETP